MTYKLNMMSPDFESLTILFYNLMAPCSYGYFGLFCLSCLFAENHLKISNRVAFYIAFYFSSSKFAQKKNGVKEVTVKHRSIVKVFVQQHHHHHPKTCDLFIQWISFFSVIHYSLWEKVGS